MSQDAIQVLSRMRVNELMEPILSHPLTVINAPMGYGKTTALKDFLRSKGIQPIWLPLVGSGGSLAYAWERLTAHIRRKKSQLGEQLNSLGFPMNAPQTAKIIDIISETHISSPAVVVIDDYHLIDDPKIASLITLIVSEEIPNLHIVLVTREEPSFDIYDLEQKQLCFIVTQEGLKFMPQEIGDYFRLMQFNPPHDILNKVAEWTGGWISGIYLVMRGLQQGLTIGRIDTIDELIEKNLYSFYDQNTRLFLIKLAVLGEFSAKEVEFVLEEPDATSQLRTICRGNAFISYNHLSGRYQMINLFQDFLMEKGRQIGFDFHRIYVRAGNWFLSCNKRIAAYDFLSSAGELEAILKDLNDGDNQDVSFAQFPQIHKIFEGLPEEVSYRYPIATMHYVRAKAILCKREDIEELNQRLYRMEQHFLYADLPVKQKNKILGDLYNTWIFIAFNDPHKVIWYADRALQYFNGKHSVVVPTQAEFNFGAPHLLYAYYKNNGRLREDAEFMATNFHKLAQTVEGCGAGSESLVMAEFSLETGAFDNVSINAYKAIYQSRAYDQICIEICAVFALARLSFMLGRFEEGDKLITELADNVDKYNNSVLNTTLTVCMGYLDSCLGKEENIPEWLKNNDMDSGSFMFQGMAFNYIVCARAVLLSGNFVRLDVLCEEFEQHFSVFENQLGYIHNHICAAIAKEKLYGMEAGKKRMLTALEIAQKDHVVMPFAETAEYVLPILKELRNEGKFYPAFLDELLACCEMYQKSLTILREVPVNLSEREREVISMLTQSLSHKEIAEKLYISVPTVRYHVKNAYGKLKVNNKLAAIQKAKELGLI